MAMGAAASNVDLYQVNTTIFDAMGRDEEAYLLARSIQFMLPGIPQVDIMWACWRARMISRC